MIRVIGYLIAFFLLLFNFKGRLWIHAASKVPDEETIRAMEDFYREIYAVDGITDIKFPEHYPVSRLLGMFLQALTYQNQDQVG